MKVTPEMMAKFENCKSAEEIMDLAKKFDIQVNMKQAQDVFDLLKSEDISDEMLKKVCGGLFLEGIRIRSGAGYLDDGGETGGGTLK